jgi:hypothetical protein
MIGWATAPIAHAEEVVDVTDPTPAELLDMASAALTDANHVMDQASVVNPDQETIFDRQMDIQDTGLRFLDNQGSFQDQLLLDDNSSSDLLSQLFTQADQGLHQAGEATLAAGQPFLDPLAGSDLMDALAGLFAADVQMFGAEVGALVYDVGALFASFLDF